MYSQKRNKYTLEDAKKYQERIYDKVSDMDKIALKCWIAYCEYAKREENKEEAMRFEVYCNIVSVSTYLGHIQSGEINCDDIGGKEVSTEIVKKWFGISN